MEMYDNLVHSLYLFLLVTKGKGVQYPLITPSLVFLKLRLPSPEKLLGHLALENVLLSVQKNICCDSCSQFSDWVIRNKTDECF